jgi:hypothetical protein
MIIQRGKNSYCYRSRKDGKKEYLGKVSTPIALTFLVAQQQKVVEKAQRNKIRAERDATLQEARYLLDLLNIIWRTYVLLQGYYRRKSELRRIPNDYTS